MLQFGNTSHCEGGGISCISFEWALSSLVPLLGSGIAFWINAFFLRFFFLSLMALRQYLFTEDEHG